VADILGLAGQVGAAAAARDHVGRAKADHLAGQVAHARHVDALEEADAFALQVLKPLFGGGIERKLVGDAARSPVDLCDGGIEFVERPAPAIGKIVTHGVQVLW
jgi:hypothetical protein